MWSEAIYVVSLMDYDSPRWCMIGIRSTRMNGHIVSALYHFPDTARYISEIGLSPSAHAVFPKHSLIPAIV